MKGDHLVINRNPHYWLKDAQGNFLPYLQAIRYRPISNESVMFSNLAMGTINSADPLAPNNVTIAKSKTRATQLGLPHQQKSDDLNIPC